MNDNDWIVEIRTEKDRVLLTFASYATAEEFERTFWLGITNTEQEQVVQVTKYKEP